MVYKLRDYQEQAVQKAVEFFTGTEEFNALVVLPTGAGKSLVIAEIAHRLNSNVLVFSPSKEITEQNYAKMKNYTEDCSMYSASTGMKVISKITFATIGSVKDKTDDFSEFDYIIIDEAHGVNGEGGMYLNFLKCIGGRVLGLTATPFRLTQERYFDKELKEMRTRNSQLIVLTNDENKFFDRIIYKVQVNDLLCQGFLARLKYFDLRPKYWNEDKMFKNTQGTEYSTKSVQWLMEQTNLTSHLASICNRLLHPKNGVPRNGILVFTQFVDDAMELCSLVPDSAFITGETTKKNRERILEEFKNGEIKVLANVGTLTTGLDIPKLDTIVMGRPTLSLSIYYQCIGRALRPYEGKDAWIVDAVGNFNRFGDVSNIRIETSKATGTDEVFGYAFDYEKRAFAWKQLTGIYLN